MINEGITPRIAGVTKYWIKIEYIISLTSSKP